ARQLTRAGKNLVRIAHQRLRIGQEALAERGELRAVPADLDTLNEIGFIALQRARGQGLAAQVDRWCVERRFVPHVTQQAEDVQSVLASVAAGAGVAFIPSRAQYLLRDATVLPLDGKDAKWRVGLAWLSDRDDPVTTRFVSFMRAAIKNA
ncbi:LysR substrate-binding domain-containing protein, partial [Burkholderia sp. 4M9327G5]|uniref:LysR substrate-binding domain-containing protein n=1 Tax=Burkholderia sp. 4M9327G5 TaxID=2502224 RepID=UPI002017BED5